jgi:hypothetical protein
MDQYIEQAKAILDMLSHIVFGLVIMATAIVRLTPTKSDDKKLSEILVKVHKLFSYLPTMGINPKTKELEDLQKKVSQDVPKSE